MFGHDIRLAGKMGLRDALTELPEERDRGGERAGLSAHASLFSHLKTRDSPYRASIRAIS